MPNEQQSPYPTQEEIMSNPWREFVPDTPFYNENVITLVKNWKRSYLRHYRTSDNNQDRFLFVMNLLYALNEFYGGGRLQVHYFAHAGIPFYSPLDKTIVLAPPISIISALHELGHHLFGEEELKACRFSVWLFKACFPKSFAKLKWEGHMLRKI